MPGNALFHERGSSITEIMDILVRNQLEKRDDIVDFKQDIQFRHKKLLGKEKIPELTELEEGLSNTLRSFVPDVSLSLKWSELPDISITMPQAQIKLIEDRYEAGSEQTGHGLQRALIITMLQRLVAARETASSLEEENPSEKPK